MSKFNYTDKEKEFNKVLYNQSQRIEGIEMPEMNSIEESIKDSESLLKSLGYNVDDAAQNFPTEKKVIRIPAWDEVVASTGIEAGVDLESLFTEEELKSNEDYILKLHEEFNQIHRLDEIDYAIAVGAGMLGAITDILLVGFPEPYTTDSEEKPLSKLVREYFDNLYSEEELSKLVKAAKVPYDANHNSVNNDFVTNYVEGLTPQYHRLVSLGHDPILGFVFGVKDIMNGTMTTIDKKGEFVVQNMGNFKDYSQRKEKQIVEAIFKQIRHLKSDMTTPIGLPAPFMGLFNLFQFGSIGEDDQTIAEIVQSMYYEGYDFRHFCTMSIPMMITEIVARLGYTLKKMSSGYSVRESVAISVNRNKNPKLGTMLFIASSIEVAANAGKICFCKDFDPYKFNYPQWVMFAKYSYQQLKWVLVQKPEYRHKYVEDDLSQAYCDIMYQINETYEKLNELNERYEFVFE